MQKYRAAKNKGVLCITFYSVKYRSKKIGHIFFLGRSEWLFPLKSKSIALNSLLTGIFTLFSPPPLQILTFFLTAKCPYEAYVVDGNCKFAFLNFPGGPSVIKEYRLKYVRG